MVCACDHVHQCHCSGRVERIEFDMVLGQFVPQNGDGDCEEQGKYSLQLSNIYIYIKGLVSWWIISWCFVTWWIV